jgi:predicted nucleotidyltransferase
MNSHVHWRLAFGRELSAKLRPIVELESIVVVGSVARGLSDSYSDLELMLVWSQAPTPEQRSAIIQVLQAEYRYPPFDPGYQSAFRIQGIAVDLWHTTAAQEEAFIRQVVEDYSIDLVANNRLDTLASCIPLRGPALVQRWKAAIQAYPTELTLRFLQAYLPHFHLRQLNLAAHRENPTAYYHTLTNIQCSLFLVLLALNKHYFPTFKWLYPTLASLHVAPPQVAARLRHMVDESPPQAAQQLRDLLAETLDIVEAQYPHVHTAYARYGLEQEAQAYDVPPSW